MTLKVAQGSTENKEGSWNFDSTANRIIYLHVYLEHNEIFTFSYACANQLLDSQYITHVSCFNVPFHIIISFLLVNVALISKTNKCKKILIKYPPFFAILYLKREGIR